MSQVDKLVDLGAWPQCQGAYKVPHSPLRMEATVFHLATLGGIQIPFLRSSLGIPWNTYSPCRTATAEPPCVPPLAILDKWAFDIFEEKVFPCVQRKGHSLFTILRCRGWGDGRDWVIMYVCMYVCIADELKPCAISLPPPLRKSARSSVRDRL